MLTTERSERHNLNKKCNKQIKLRIVLRCVHCALLHLPAHCLPALFGTERPPRLGAASWELSFGKMLSIFLVITLFCFVMVSKLNLNWFISISKQCEMMGWDWSKATLWAAALSLRPGTAASKMDCCCCFTRPERSLEDAQGCCCCCLPKSAAWRLRCQDVHFPRHIMFGKGVGLVITSVIFVFSKTPR